MGGKVWPILFTHRVLLELENLTGCNIFKGELHFSSISAKLLRSVLFVILHAAGCPLSVEEIGKFLRPAKMMESRKLLVDAWNASLAPPEEEEEGDEPVDKKKKDFGWLEAWSVARLDLRLSDSEWLDMTPRMLHALMAHWKTRVQEHEFFFSRIASVVSFYGGRGPKEPLPEEHFMLHPLKKKPEEEQTGDDILRMFSPFMTPESRKLTHEILNIND